MRHRYECPTRWADLDLLGHVNNVVYVDYLQEARVDMLREVRPPAAEPADDLVEGIVVARHEVGYRKPLHFAFEPISIECWVTDIRAASFTMAYEVFRDGGPGSDGERTTYLRATTRLAPYVFGAERPRRLTPEERAALEVYLEPPEEPAARPARVRVTPTEIGHYPVHVRFSDVDVYGHVNNVKYFEYLQEARIRWHAAVTEGLDDVPAFHMVVAQTDVDYLQPILLRPEPYDCWSQVTRVGDRSMTMESEIADGERVLARARIGMVFFDTDSQRATQPPAAYRDRLLELAAPSSG